MCEINQQSQNFINIISAHINRVEPELAEPQWNEIVELANIHNLSAMVWASIKDKTACDDEAVLNKLKNSFNATVQYSVVQELVTEGLVALLNKNKISHILFKGFVLRELYPCKELRTMGDIDIIVKPSQQEEVHRLLLENGFTFDELNSHADVRNYEKNRVCYEIHTAIVSKNVYDDVDAVEYFKDSFKHAHTVKDFTYEFSNEHHLIYLLQHMAKHFKFSGCGVRMLLDIPVFIKSYGKELDWEYIKGELEALGLLQFCCNIFALCRLWFNMDTPFESELDKEQLGVIGSYIMAGGVFGYENKSIDALRINNGNAGFLKKIINILGLIFPSYSHLSERYVWFKGTPKWLLPVGWVRLWWYRIVKKRENGIYRLKAALRGSDDASKHNSVLNIIGLKK